MMGYTPDQVDAMSLWKFNACFNGFLKLNGAKPKSSPLEVDDERLSRMGIEGFGNG